MTVSPANEDGRRKLTKAARRRAKKKEKKLLEEKKKEVNPPAGSSSEKAKDNNVEIEYVSAGYESSPMIAEFQEVFAKFAKAEELMRPKDSGVEKHDEKSVEEVQDQVQEEEAALSRRKRKALSRMSVAELKQVVTRPDTVETHDVTAPDPRLLVHLKASRNAVPVPRHWCHKRRYLQGKRGLEKKPFRLPEFIAQTGIEKIRKAIEEAEALKKIKQQTRDRIHGRGGGRMDIDYQVLHDAFFKWQTKPRLSGAGQVYYEGKEYEVHMREKRPGQLSAALKAALGMPEGAPPPWLINMQRFGPPPAYPNLRIPGLNAPIPQGASFGYHPGGWGKPPVDEYGVPLYGDVFGARRAMASNFEGDDYLPDRTPWAEMQVDHEEDDDDESASSPDNEERPQPTSGRYQSTARTEPSSVVVAGTETPIDDGTASLMSAGIETSSAIDLRKRPEETNIDEPRALYQLIEEERAKADARAAGIFTSEKRYRLPSALSSDQNLPPDLETHAAPPANNRQHNDDDDDDDDDDPVDGSSKRRRLDNDGRAGASSRRRRDFKF